jgi:hypothetical protein
VIKKWAKNHPRGAVVFLNCMMIGTTALFALIALGPDSLLDQDCSPNSAKCLDSHAGAAVWAIVSGIVAAFILWRTVRAVRKGAFKRPPLPDSSRESSR